jgi:hypothetical protein
VNRFGSREIALRAANSRALVPVVKICPNPPLTKMAKGDLLFSGAQAGPLNIKGRFASRVLFVALIWACMLCPTALAEAFDVPDLVSSFFESPDFSGKEPIDKLYQAAELLRAKKVKPSEMAFALLDWGDRYVREPADPLERLKRWAQLSSDEKLSHIRIPREFLNRALVAEYLVDKTPYLASPPQKRLELLQRLAEQHLLDWSVSLAYARLYAGAIISGAKTYGKTSPIEGLAVLKHLKDQGLVGRHYAVPTEAILTAEALAVDAEYVKGSSTERLIKLRDLDRKGLITSLTKRELERLPVWRLLTNDPSFAKADSAAKKERLSKLRDQGLISASSYSDLAAIFRPVPVPSAAQGKPMPVPQKPAVPATQPESER